MPNKKILIINIFGIGDVLFTTPLISRIKEQVPDAFIGYVGNKRTAPVLAANPKINRVFVYERDDFQDSYRKSKLQFFGKLNGLLTEIKKERFDTVIDLSLNGSASFLMWFIGIKNRVGFNYRDRSPFLSHPVKLNGYEGRHVVDYYLSFLGELGLSAAASGTMEIPVPQADRAWADEWFKKNGLADGKPVVGIVPGGGASWGKDAPFKRWGAENYAKLADKIVEKFSAHIILMGDESERELCAFVAKVMRQRPFSAYGQTTLTQFAALMSKCSLAVLNDGGPLHVAVAAGVRTVSIFGPVDSQVYGPYPAGNHSVVKRDLACQPCYRRFRMSGCRHVSCLNSIEVDEVFRKVEQAL